MANISDQQIREIVERYHTPLYIFSEPAIRQQCRLLKAAIQYENMSIRYASKALTLQAILKIVHSEGLSIDAVSMNEVTRSLRAGFDPEEILYTGEGASRLVFAQLLEMGVTINCSSIDQLRLIGSIRPGAKCSIRINPGEGHGASNKTNTGGPSSKHGIYFDQLDLVDEAVRQGGLRLAGVHSHIGSEADLSHWLRIKDKTLEVAIRFGDLEFVNLGGGIPVVYNPETDSPMPLSAWGDALTDSMTKLSRKLGRAIQLQIEPGRFVVASSGLLVAEAQNVKSTPNFNFVIVNSGMHHNPRPAMYGSYHPIRFLSRDHGGRGGEREYVVAGNLCESGDLFTVDREGHLLPRKFPEIRVGDLMIIEMAGAYCHSMKSEYNSMNPPASVLVEEGGGMRLIERRGTVDDLMRRELDVEGRLSDVSLSGREGSPPPAVIWDSKSTLRTNRN